MKGNSKEENQRLCERGLPRWFSGKESPANAEGTVDKGLIPGSGRSPREGYGTHSIFLPGKSHGQRSLMGYQPWGRKESDMTE